MFLCMATIGIMGIRTVVECLHMYSHALCILQYCGCTLTSFSDFNSVDPFVLMLERKGLKETAIKTLIGELR